MTGEEIKRSRPRFIGPGKGIGSPQVHVPFVIPVPAFLWRDRGRLLHFLARRLGPGQGYGREQSERYQTQIQWLNFSLG